MKTRVDFAELFDAGDWNLLDPVMDALFARVTAFAVAKYGPLDQFVVRSVRTTAWIRCVDGTAAGRGFSPDPPEGFKCICGEGRAWGGALSRFYAAHWEMKASAPSWETWLPDLTRAALAYGWALNGVCQYEGPLCDEDGPYDVTDIGAEIEDPDAEAIEEGERP